MAETIDELKKVCKHCGIAKQTSEYNKAGGGKWLQPYCKPCDSERKRKYCQENRDAVLTKKKAYYEKNKSYLIAKQKEYNEKNSDVVSQRRKEYYDKNRELKRAKDREYRKAKSVEIDLKQKLKRIDNPEWWKQKLKRFRDSRTPEQKERQKIQQKEWRLKNKEKIKARRQLPEVKERKRERARINANIKASTDISFKIVKNLRSRIGFALKRNIKKSATTKELLGCSVDYFKEYFKSLFTEGMTWELFMSGDIHIDHKKPCKEFDLIKPEQQRECFHYTNLQPLWWYDNLKKGAKYYE